jgi:hypothetical protein
VSVLSYGHRGSDQNDVVKIADSTTNSILEALRSIFCDFFKLHFFNACRLRQTTCFFVQNARRRLPSWDQNDVVKIADSTTNSILEALRSIFCDERPAD